MLCARNNYFVLFGKNVEVCRLVCIFTEIKEGEGLTKQI